MTADAPIILRASPQDFIEVSKVERFSDGSGYRSQLSVASGGFSCSGHPFYFDDLDGFTKAITKAYDRVGGKARLAHNYEEDFIEVEVLRGGHVSVAGFIVQHGPPHQELRFAFGCDQTFLPELLRSLKQMAGELERES
jgi:hypothetical protein